MSSREALRIHSLREKHTQAQVKAFAGGLGIRNLEDHCGAAFTGASLGAKKLVREILRDPEDAPLEQPHLAQAVEHYNARVADSHKIANVAALNPKLTNQKVLSDRIDRCKFAKLKSPNLPLPELARLNAVSMKYSGSFLGARCGFFRGPHMSEKEFHEALKLRIGYEYPPNSLCPLPHPHPTPFGPFASHLMTCKATGDRIRRHNDVRDFLVETAHEAEYTASKEPQGLLPNFRNGNSKPADVLVRQYEGGRDLAIDVTVVNSVQTSSLTNAAVTSGAAILSAETAKIRKYRDACTRAGFNFQPFVVESYGGLGHHAVSLIKTLALRISRQRNLHLSVVTHRLFCDLSVVLQRANAHAILERLPERAPSRFDDLEPL